MQAIFQKPISCCPGLSHSLHQPREAGHDAKHGTRPFACGCPPCLAEAACLCSGSSYVDPAALSASAMRTAFSLDSCAARPRRSKALAAQNSSSSRGPVLSSPACVYRINLGLGKANPKPQPQVGATQRSPALEHPANPRRAPSPGPLPEPCGGHCLPSGQQEPALCDRHAHHVASHVLFSGKDTSTFLTELNSYKE